METQIKIGDVVLLKSGGPKMTVYFIINDTISCQWFDNNNEAKNGDFIISTLKLFKPYIFLKSAR